MELGHEVESNDADLPLTLAEHSYPFQSIDELQPLLDEVDGQRLILMGEATHGTSEFYRWRAKLSRYLVENKDIRFIAVEGDWPALYEVNRYIKQKEGAASSAAEAMEAIDRWPLWMWRNREVKELIEWLRSYNSSLEPEERIGFYGVDLYNHEGAMDSVIDYLEERNPVMAREATIAYACLRRFNDVRNYLQRVATTRDHCGEDVKGVLDLLHDQKQWSSDDPAGFFHAEQSARIVVNAENYYRANLIQGSGSWNIRATHFFTTAHQLLNHYGEESSGIIWAHNTHIGDARATEMSSVGMVNIGQLAREKLSDDAVYTIGFGTDSGRVLAAGQWEGAKEVMQIPEAQSRSWEQLLREMDEEQLFLLFSDPVLTAALEEPILHRAIGVTYNPRQEAQYNYVLSRLPARYDAFLFFRETDILDTLDP